MSDGLSAQETTKLTDETSTAQQATEASSVPISAAETGLQDIVSESVRSMFLEKESPFLKIRWGGKIYVDAPVNNEPDGASVTLRKAELALSRKFGKDFQVKVTGNYNNDHFDAGDSYIVYSGWKTAVVALGIQTPPFSLEATSSSSAITFMEDSLPVGALAEPKSAGLNILKRTSGSVLSASLIFHSPSQDGFSEPGRAFVGRYVHSPLTFHNQKNFHLGGSFSYRFLESETDFDLQTRPEIATADVYYINTGPVENGDKVLRLGLEASQVRGRFSWQTEVLSTHLKRKDASSLKFWGAYVHVSQFLTNDSRNYDQGSASFNPVVPNSPIGRGGWGALEVAFRVSYADLTDQEVIGGQESNISLGVNWYLNEKVRLMANAIKVLDVDRPGSEYDGLNPLILAVRAQWLIY